MIMKAEGFMICCPYTGELGKLAVYFSLSLKAQEPRKLMVQLNNLGLKTRNQRWPPVSVLETKGPRIQISHVWRQERMDVSA